MVVKKTSKSGSGSETRASRLKRKKETPRDLGGKTGAVKGGVLTGTRNPPTRTILPTQISMCARGC